MTAKPIMPWQSQEDCDPEGRVVWWTRLDGRYQIEVHRKGKYDGTLFIWDRACTCGMHPGDDPGCRRHGRQGDEWIGGKAVTLSYGAIFGPDMADVEEWKQFVIDFVDSRPEGDK